MTVSLYRISFVRFAGELRRRLAHIQLAGHHAGYEPRAVLFHKLDLSVGAVYGGIDVCDGLVQMLDDGDLFG